MSAFSISHLEMMVLAAERFVDMWIIWLVQMSVCPTAAGVTRVSGFNFLASYWLLVGWHSALPNCELWTVLIRIADAERLSTGQSIHSFLAASQPNYIIKITEKQEVGSDSVLAWLILAAHWSLVSLASEDIRMTRGDWNDEHYKVQAGPRLQAELKIFCSLC